jgi:hypothetical protein
VEVAVLHELVMHQVQVELLLQQPLHQLLGRKEVQQLVELKIKVPMIKQPVNNNHN